MRPTARLILPFIPVLAFAIAPPADAQYFGRNSVQWDRLKFEVLKTDHFDVYYYAEEKLAAEQVGRMGERWYARFSTLLRHQMKERQPVILYASNAHFQQTNTLGGAPGEGTGGVTEAYKRRIVLPVGASMAETDHVLGHELVHAFQYDMTGQGRISDTNYPAALRMPLWFIEGMAEYLSVGPDDPHTAMWLRDAARREKGLPTIRQLDDSAKYFPYRYGQALWAYIASRYGDEVFGRMLRGIRPQANDAEEVLKGVLHVDPAELSKDWHAAIRADYAKAATGRKDADSYGAAMVTEKGQGGRLNVGPVLSPDGNRLAFLSERDRFSVELFLQDTHTGNVTKQLSRTVVDPHLESIQFINSAGSFDRAGQRFALGGLVKGRAALVLIDAKKGSKVELPFPSLGEINTPSFSPDGKKVVFSALSGGFSDLFIYDLDTKALRHVTEDAFADLQPVWSPDGRQIAFVTDRFSTDLATLRAGNYRLAVLDVESGTITEVPTFEKGKNINPQWTKDGKGLYFLSDHTGITNVYRLDVASRDLFQLTDLISGVSGITGLSPALSVAVDTGRIAYSVYDEDRYEIYSIDDVEKLAGWRVLVEAPRTASVIPGGKDEGKLVEAQNDALKGLADANTFTHKPYKAKFGLDYIGQPYLSGGSGSYGAFFGGGIAMGFSDMLGNHSLGTVFQVDHQVGYTNVGGVVNYLNKSRRVNWGVQIDRIPYISGGLSAGYTTVNGRQTYVEQTVLYQQTDSGITAQAFYPLDTTLRVEVGSGLRNIGFTTRTLTAGYIVNTGQQIIDDRQSQSDPSINLWQGTVALVKDSSVFGATSPIMGQRFRLDVSPTRGTIDYTGITADLRRYIMPIRPVTIAARLLHYGRYGAGGEDQRLYPLFIGYPDLVRGYDTGSFSASECGVQTNGSCPVFDRLIGSRMLVGNLEVRAPLLGLFGKRNLYGPIPIEIGAFFDAGVAWDSGSKPDLFGGDRPLAKSTGATARINVFGVLIFQVDYVKPLDRPGKGAFFQFNLLSGF
jgi:Tol biopolymer transport system component